ncbi:MAG TPA: 50S ribosomal protein L20 [Candidatus Azoamicus sp. MARI]
MTRIKRGTNTKRKHKKILKLTKGYYGAKSKTFKVAKQAFIKAQQYSYRDRKNKKRTFRSLWIININSALRKYDMTYSKFINLAKKSNIIINRKNLYNLIKDNESNLKCILDGLWTKKNVNDRLYNTTIIK